MDTAWAVVLIVFGLVAWLGQALARFAPATAARLSLMEEQETVEPVYWADIRGEALCDVLTLWTLVAAGVLLLLGRDEWSYFGLAGGAIYLYFAGRGILTRLEMRHRGLRIGETGSVRVALIVLAMWGLIGLITVIAAVTALTNR